MNKVSLQEYWDMLVLNGWIEDRKFWMILRDFSVYSGRPNNDFNVLLDRIKRSLLVNFKKDTQKPLRAVIAPKLPEFNQYLWHIYPVFTDETYNTAMGILRGSKQRRSHRQKRDEWSEIKELGVENDRTKAVDINADHRRSDWQIVKRTNNR